MGEYENTSRISKRPSALFRLHESALSRRAGARLAVVAEVQLGADPIPGKYRELGGLAVAANIKCPYCQLMHTAVAQFYGATQEELAEDYYLASLTARWSAMIHAQNYDWDTFAEEAKQRGGLQKRARK